MGGLHETRGQFTVSSTEAEGNGQYRDETENSPRCLLRNTTTKTKKPMLLHRSYKRLFIAFSISNSIRQNWIGPHFFTLLSYLFSQNAIHACQEKSEERKVKREENQNKTPIHLRELAYNLIFSILKCSRKQSASV